MRGYQRQLVAGRRWMIFHLDAPPIHHDHGRALDFVQYFGYAFSLVTATPPETPRQVVPRPKWDDPDRWLTLQLNRVHRFQNPAHGAIATAAYHLEVGHVLEHRQTLDGTSLGQVVHLTRVEQVLKLPQYPVSLATATFRVDEHQQWANVCASADLKVDRR